jgi:hypothetical protein
VLRDKWENLGGITVSYSTYLFYVGQPFHHSSISHSFNHVSEVEAYFASAGHPNLRGVALA